jgi:hypothetical protein
MSTVSSPDGVPMLRKMPSAYQSTQLEDVSKSQGATTELDRID